jgi:hypothetical protein
MSELERYKIIWEVVARYHERRAQDAAFVAKQARSVVDQVTLESARSCASAFDWLESGTKARYAVEDAAFARELEATLRRLADEREAAEVQP